MPGVRALESCISEFKQALSRLILRLGKLELSGTFPGYNLLSLPWAPPREDVLAAKRRETSEVVSLPRLNEQE